MHLSVLSRVTQVRPTELLEVGGKNRLSGIICRWNLWFCVARPTCSGFVRVKA